MSDPGIAALFFSALLAMALWTSLALGSDLLSDPTRPPAAIDAAVENLDKTIDTRLDLRAVIYADGRRLAIINGERVRENDRVGSARVVAIEPDRVRLRRGNETIDLELVKGDVKRIPGWLPERLDATDEPSRLDDDTRVDPVPAAPSAGPSRSRPESPE